MSERDATDAEKAEESNGDEGTAGIEDDPTTEIEEVVGSGPFEVTNFRQGEIIQTTPYDDHWEAPDWNLSFQFFQNANSAFQAFQDGSLNLFVGVAPGISNQIDENMTDIASVTTTQGFLPYGLAPQMNFGPTKFREFRMAVSQAIDRTTLNQVGVYGQSEPLLYSSVLTPTHPWYPDDHEGLTQIAESAGANPERAQQVLEENGWTWDEEGNLHYPADADLSPSWPQGDTPMDHPDQFPCLE